MKILFLGDIIGLSGCKAVTQNLPTIIKKKNIDFVIVNGENAAENGLGITNKIAIDLFNSGVNVITSGNHIWEQKETLNFIKKEDRLLRPYNSYSPIPGKGLERCDSNRRSLTREIPDSTAPLCRGKENLLEGPRIGEIEADG